MNRTTKIKERKKVVFTLKYSLSGFYFFKISMLIATLSGCQPNPSVVSFDIIAIDADTLNNRILVVTENIVWPGATDLLTADRDTAQLQYFDPSSSSYTWIADISDEPSDIAVDSISQRVYVSKKYSASMEIVELTTGQSTFMPISIATNSTPFPTSIAYDPIDNRLYMNIDAGLLALDIATGDTIPIELPMDNPRKLVIDADGRRLFIADATAIYIVDLQSNIST